ncbi:MAG: L-rhamnose isomerase [Cyclobacteriaceae bacterium]|nr:L-rhamnose isomerase [Cyclobacteriaceae bacterium]
MMKEQSILNAYELAKEQYQSVDVQVEDTLADLDKINLSVHCWQADDVSGFEQDAGALGGGLAVTGNYPGKARNIQEMRTDLQKVYSLVPGRQRLSLHAIYGEFGNKKVDRDEISIDHFQGWADWSRQYGIDLDFNATLFSHARANEGFTLSSKNEGNRQFWIEHVRRCREISAWFGRQQGNTCVHNTWIPDGMKDTTIDRFGYRKLLMESLDEALRIKYPTSEMKDAVESKLFGIGSESFVVGSHEFYLGYAISRGILLCIDAGHFHPTEVVGDKISAVYQYVDEVLLHLTRGVRWDSDHVITMNDETVLIAQELRRMDAFGKTSIGLDFFDASINRIGAYVSGIRSAQKSILYALLEPTDTLRKYEENGQWFERLALLEEMKTKPFGAVWDFYCLQHDVPVAQDYIAAVGEYEKKELSNRI